MHTNNKIYLIFIYPALFSFLRKTTVHSLTFTSWTHHHTLLFVLLQHFKLIDTLTSPFYRQLENWIKGQKTRTTTMKQDIWDGYLTCVTSLTVVLVSSLQTNQQHETRQSASETQSLTSEGQKGPRRMDGLLLNGWWLLKYNINK